MCAGNPCVIAEKGLSLLLPSLGQRLAFHPGWVQPCHSQSLNNTPVMPHRSVGTSHFSPGNVSQCSAVGSCETRLLMLTQGYRGEANPSGPPPNPQLISPPKTKGPQKVCFPVSASPPDSSELHPSLLLPFWGSRKSVLLLLTAHLSICILALQSFPPLRNLHSPFQSYSLLKKPMHENPCTGRVPQSNLPQG